VIDLRLSSFFTRCFQEEKKRELRTPSGGRRVSEDGGSQISTRCSFNCNKGEKKGKGGGSRRPGHVRRIKPLNSEVQRDPHNRFSELTDPPCRKGKRNHPVLVFAGGGQRRGGGQPPPKREEDIHYVPETLTGEEEKSRCRSLPTSHRRHSGKERKKKPNRRRFRKEANRAGVDGGIRPRRTAAEKKRKGESIVTVERG